MKKLVFLFVFILSILENSNAQFNLLNTYSKNGHRIIEIALSPDQSNIATCGTDKSIIIWDNQGNIVKKFTHLAFLTTHLEFSADAKFIIASGESKKVLIWDIEAGTTRFTLSGHSKNVTSISCSKDGLLATGSEDKTICIWEIKTGKIVNQIDAQIGKIVTLAFSGDGKNLAAAGSSSSIKIWDTNNWASKMEIKTPSQPSRFLKYSHDNNYIINASSNTICLWSAASGLMDNEIVAPFGKFRITSMDVSPDDNYIVAGSIVNTYGIWNMKRTGIYISEKQKDAVISAIFSKDGRFLYTADNTDKLKIWDVSSLKIRSAETSLYNNFKKDLIPPEIILTTTGIKKGFKLIVKKPAYTISGKVIDDNQIMLVFLNGIELNLSTNGEFSSTIKLKKGDNLIDLKAIDIAGNISEENFVVRLESENSLSDFEDSENTFAKGKYYALIIGISEYQDHAIPDLGGVPNEDAKSLSEILITNYIFEQENVQILKDPTRRDILIAMDNLSKNLTADDNLLIFYAGHGYYEEENDIGYWLPADAEYNFTANWVYNNNLVDLMKKVKSKHTLLISDACFSGSIFKSRDAFLEGASRAYVNLYALKSRKAMTSGNLKTVPNRSLFFEYLTKNLINNTDKYLSSRELFGKLSKDVGNETENVPQWGDIPGIGDEGGDFIFIKR